MKLLRAGLVLLGVVLLLVGGRAAVLLDRDQVPLTAQDAPAMLADYDERNAPLARGSHDGQAQAWETVDTGPTLAIDRFATRVNAVIAPDREHRPFVHEMEGIYPLAQSSYPLWTLVTTRVDHPGSSAAQRRDDAAAPLSIIAFVQEHPDAPWRMDAWSSQAAELPDPLPPDRAVATGEDRERAAEIDALLGAWWEQGAASGLAPSADLETWRADMIRTGEGVRAVTTTAQGWGADLGSSDPSGPVRVLRVDGGLLVHTTQGWVVDAEVEAGAWVFGEDRAEIVGPEPEGTAQDTFAATVTVFVPEEGDAEVVGWLTDHVDAIP